MYKKKVQPQKSSFLTALMAMFIVVGVFCISEYYLYFPSSVLHNPGLLRAFYEENTSPPGCTADYAPVCGKDGKTYTNSCESKLAGVAVARVGKCQNSAETSTDNSNSSLSGSTQTASTVPPSSPAVSSEIIPVGLAMSGGEIDMSKYQRYTNSVFGYSVLIPKYAYYQGLVTPDKKNHILTIDLTASGVQNTTTALIRAKYFKPLQEPDISSAQKVIPLENGAKVLVNYEEPLSKKGQEILDTLLATYSVAE